VAKKGNSNNSGGKHPQQWWRSGIPKASGDCRLVIIASAVFSAVYTVDEQETGYCALRFRRCTPHGESGLHLYFSAD